MSDTPNDAAERESLKTRNWILAAVAGVLLVLLQGFFTYSMNSAVNRAEKWGDKLEEVATMQKVQTVKVEEIDQRVGRLETAREKANEAHSGYDQRLNTLEARAGFHNR